MISSRLAAAVVIAFFVSLFRYTDGFLFNKNVHNSRVSHHKSCGRDMSKTLGKIVSNFLVSLSILTVNPLLPAEIANAQDSSVVWTDRQRLAAEAWRSVDDLFYDRTFNGQDWFQLRQSVVNQAYNTDDEVYKSLQAMLVKLGDKYTRYLTPAQYSVILNSALGELTGVGVELLGVDGKVKITNIEDDSPAKDSGIQIGDIIINVDGTDTTALMPEEVAGLIRGKKGTKASLRVLHNGNDQVDYTVLRRSFKLKGVSYSKLDINNKRVALITIKSFSSATRGDVTRALEDLHQKYDTFDDIVIDLRNNGGGLLQGAIEVSNLFMPPGKIVVYVVQKDGKVEAQQTLPNGVISTDNNLPDLRTPVYILVNSNTASAAEVLSAALKDNNRATLIGEKTFGKGVIQTLQQLQQGGIAVTIAKYETPTHKNINKIGIPVDIEVKCDINDNVSTCIQDIIK